MNCVKFCKFHQFAAKYLLWMRYFVTFVTLISMRHLARQIVSVFYRICLMSNMSVYTGNDYFALLMHLLPLYLWIKKNLNIPNVSVLIIVSVYIGDLWYRNMVLETFFTSISIFIFHYIPHPCFLSILIIDLQ